MFLFTYYYKENPNSPDILQPELSFEELGGLIDELLGSRSNRLFFIVFVNYGLLIEYLLLSSRSRPR